MDNSRSQAPLLTFALFAYNQEKFIRAAVAAALAQSYSPLEIIFSDDCSGDATYELMSELVGKYQGPHRIIMNRNPKNLGVCAHVNKVFGLSSGALIVVAAGDDVSLPDRCARMARAWLATGASALYCEADIIDASGALVGFWALPKQQQEATRLYCDQKFSSFPFWGAGAAYEHLLYSKFGPLPESIRNEDYVLAMRGAITNGVYCVNERLMLYRKHDDNLSFWVKVNNANNLSQMLLIMAQRLDSMVANQKHILGELQQVCDQGSLIVRSFRDYMCSTQVRRGVLYAFCGRPTADIFYATGLSKGQLVLRIIIELGSQTGTLVKSSLVSLYWSMRRYFGHTR